MARKRVVLKPGIPGKIDRVVFSTAGNPLVRSDYGDTDYVCGSCGDIVISGDFPEIKFEFAEAAIFATCMKCGDHNIVPREIIPGISS